MKSINDWVKNNSNDSNIIEYSADFEKEVDDGKVAEEERI